MEIVPSPKRIMRQVLACRFSPRWLRRGSGSRRSEVYLWNLARSFCRFEIGVVRLEARPSREDVVGELLDVRVVVLQSIVVALALDSNAIFGACQLILQAHEILIRS